MLPLVLTWISHAENQNDLLAHCGLRNRTNERNTMSNTFNAGGQGEGGSCSRTSTTLHVNTREMHARIEFDDFLE